MEGTEPGVSAPRDRSRRPRRAPSPGGPTGRGQILDAAIASIVDLGFYRASTNEIARRAGVSWGSIQYHFGSRESLMLAVVEELNQRFNDAIRRARITGDTLEERLSSLYGHLAKHYDTPSYLARLQIILNLQSDPGTSAEVAQALAAQIKSTGDDLRRLLRDALGTEATPSSVDAVFHVVRGMILSRQLVDAIPSQPGTHRTSGADQQALTVLISAAAARLG